MTDPRELALRMFMLRHDITYHDIAKIFSLTAGGARSILLRETMFEERHKKLLDLGFPEEVLPAPIPYKDGRYSGARTPKFPGRPQQESHA